MRNRYVLYLIIAVIVILMLLLSREKREEIEIIGTPVEIVEDISGSGFLEIETFPSDADIFIDNENRGKSPATIYNIPVGKHDVIIKKDGYEDLVKEVNIDAGKRAFLEERFIVKVLDDDALKIIEKEIIVEEEVEVIEEIEIIEDAEEEIKIIEVVEEGTSTEIPGDGVISMENSIFLYYDFSKKEFIANRQINSDVFSRRFDTYLHFTRIYPVNIKAVNKNINEVKKEDCSGVAGSLDNLHSGRSLCIITHENDIVAVGGYWENTENAKLTYKVLS